MTPIPAFSAVAQGAVLGGGLTLLLHQEMVAPDNICMLVSAQPSHYISGDSVFGDSNKTMNSFKKI